MRDFREKLAGWFFSDWEMSLSGEPGFAGKLFAGFLLFLLCILLFAAQADRLEANYRLESDLSIGDAEEENYLMAEVSDIVTDQQGNIFVLDQKLKSIRVFSSEGSYLRHIGGEGVGPGEFSDYMFLKMAICPKGELCVLDRKICRITRFPLEGQYLSLFRIPFNPIKSRELLFDLQGNLIIWGDRTGSDKVFHVFSSEGDLLESYGNALPLPKNANRSVFREDNKLSRLSSFSIDSKTGDVLALSMMEYKIWRYYGQSDFPKVYAENQAGYFIPYITLEGGGQKIFPVKRLFSIRDLLLVGMWSNPANQVSGKEEYILDVFLAGKYQVTLKTPAILAHVDSQGRLFFAEEERITRYRLNESQGAGLQNPEINLFCILKQPSLLNLFPIHLEKHL